MVEIAHFLTMFSQLVFLWDFPAKALRKKINGAIKVCEADPLHLVRHATHEVKHSCTLIYLSCGVVQIGQPWSIIEETKLLTRTIRVHVEVFDLNRFCNMSTIFMHARAKEILQ